MRLATLAGGIALAGLSLVACPLQTPLPGFTLPADAGVRPPRIVMDTASPADTVVDAKLGCTSIKLRASVKHENVDEGFEARWFIDYKPIPQLTGYQFPPESVEASRDPSKFEYALHEFTYDAHFSALGEVHVVEVVVSNGFADQTTLADGGAVGLLNREVKRGWEAQSFRWVVHIVKPEDGVCDN
jgi:hypothetical protein